MVDINPGTAISAPPGSTVITSSSGNQANANAVATLAGVANKTTYLQGVVVTAGGATAAALVVGTISGLLGGTASFIYGAALGVALLSQPFQMLFGVLGIPASAQNTAIVVTVPALGLGNTNAAVFAWGYQV